MARLPASIEVEFGDGVVAARSPSGSHVFTASILGRVTEGGEERVYLDRLLHGPDQNWGEWRAVGAVSTILVRPMPVGC